VNEGKLRLLVSDQDSSNEDSKRAGASGGGIDSPRQRQLQQGMIDDTIISSPYLTAPVRNIQHISWWSTLTFAWAFRLLKIGYRHQLDVKHTNPLLDIDATSSINARFASIWRVEQKKQE
jgi:hypothetical protein